MEFVSGPWRVKSVRLARGDGRSRQYFRVYFHGHHVADVRTIGDVAKMMAAHGLTLSDLIRRNESQLR